MRVSLQRAISEEMPVQLNMHVSPLSGFDPSPEVVVLEASRDWVLASAIDGFSLGGHLVVSRTHVATLKTSKYLLFRKQIAQAERLWPRKLPTPKIDLTSAASILRDLQRLGKYAIVLRETQSEWNSIHCRIEKVTAHAATMLGFDGEGRWERSATVLDIADITQIRFGSQYLNLYQKYTQRNIS